MAPPLSDAVVVDVLRRVDRLTTPLVRRLGRPPELPQAEREQWWADRVTRVAAGVSAVPVSSRQPRVPSRPAPDGESPK